jgi:hypothetical protein
MKKDGIWNKRNKEIQEKERKETWKEHINKV